MKGDIQSLKFCCGYINIENDPWCNIRWKTQQLNIEYSPVVNILISISLNQATFILQKNVTLIKHSSSLFCLFNLRYFNDHYSDNLQE